MSTDALTWLFPRLPHAVASDLAAEYAHMTVGALRERCSDKHEFQYFAPTGGNRIGRETLTSLRLGLERLASQSSFPMLPSGKQAREFDQRASVYLTTTMPIVPAEASRREVWSFFCCVLVPHLVAWRFPNSYDPDRFVGSPRNAFARLWFRGYLLDDPEAEDRFWIVTKLQEDEAVQIVERPNLRGSAKLSRAIGRVFLETLQRYPAVQRMFLMREGCKRLMRLFPLVAFDLVAEVDLLGLVEGVFADAAQSLISERR